MKQPFTPEELTVLRAALAEFVLTSRIVLRDSDDHAVVTAYENDLITAQRVSRKIHAMEVGP